MLASSSRIAIEPRLERVDGVGSLNIQVVASEIHELVSREDQGDAPVNQGDFGCLEPSEFDFACWND